MSIKEATAITWIRNGGITKPKRGAIVVKKEEQIVRDLVEWLKNGPQLTLKQSQERIPEDYFPNICVNTLKNWLNGEPISLKIVRCHPGTMNGNNNKRLRSIYVENIMRDWVNGSNLVWVDETNFNLYCRRKERRSKIGCRATVIQTASEGANLHNGIVAMASSRLVKFDCIRGVVKISAGLSTGGSSVFTGWVLALKF